MTVPFPALRPIVPVGLLLALACAGTNRVETTASADSVIDEAEATITAGDMIARIGALAHDSMMGRDTPSPGLESAARYIAGEFASFGLRPGGEDGWIQRYPLPSRALDAEGVHFGTVVDGENVQIAHGTDFWTSPAKAFEDAAMGHGSLVWAGRAGAGALASGPALAGQVMVVDVPGAYDRDFRLAASAARRAAQAAGARALLVVLGAEFPADAIARFAELTTRPSRALVDPAEIPVFFVRRDAARAMLARGGVDLETLAPATPAPLVLPGIDAHFAAVARVLEDANPPNVIGILPGSDPALRDTYVVFSAHMDHDGVGTADATGDSIYNGADDDASGTAALIEVAQAFASLPEPPARSLLFLAVSGEEKGLLGSRWFSDHPTVPIESIVANLNVDMIGRNAPDSIVVIGMGYSSMGPLVQSVARENPELGLAVMDDPWPEERFFFRSDHFNFAAKEIPALFFFAGTHEDYHQPSDEVEKIDGSKASRVARLIFRTALALAEAPERPVWVPAGLEEVRAMTR